jgi:hypothetical protein
MFWRYWSMVFKEARREVRSRFGLGLAGLLVVGVATFFVSWARGDTSGIDALITAVIVAAVLGLVAFVVLVAAIPARSFQDIENARRDMMIVQQRGGARIGLLDVARIARENALRARTELERGESVDVSGLHSHAVRLALLAIKRIEVARDPFGAEAGSFSRAVDGDPADAAEAIAQLEELARAIDQQILEARWP